MSEPRIGPLHGHSLPDTLALEVFLDACAPSAVPADGRPKIVRRIITAIEAFLQKFEGGTPYSLLSTPQLIEKQAAISQAFADALGRYGADIEFRSRRKFAAGIAKEPEPEGDPENTRALLKRLLTAASRRSFGSLLVWNKHASKYVDGSGRALENLVGLTLGTRSLGEAVEHGFGRPFAHVFKDDIVAFWTNVCAAYADGDAEQVGRLLVLADILRQTFPITYLETGEINPVSLEQVVRPVWIMMVD